MAGFSVTAMQIRLIFNRKSDIFARLLSLCSISPFAGEPNQIRIEQVSGGVRFMQEQKSTRTIS